LSSFFVVSEEKVLLSKVENWSYLRLILGKMPVLLKPIFLKNLKSGNPQFTL